MSKETSTRIIELAFQEVDEDGSIHFAFQGGEPTLAGLSFFKYFVSRVKKQKALKQTIRFSLQTNGMQMDEEWITFLKSEHFLVGISIDGFETNHNQFRLKQEKGTYFQVLANYERLRKAGILVNVLTVLTQELAAHPKALYRFYQDHHMEYIQFIPCLDLGKQTHGVSLQPASFASFYIAFFREWRKEIEKGKVRSIALFDNLQFMLMDSLPYTCGMLGRCAFQYVIESDGAVYPCDFYAMDEFHCGNVHTKTLQELRNSKPACEFLETKVELPFCQHCEVRRFCYGNCKAKRPTFLDEDKNYCGFKVFLTYALPLLAYDVGL